jgi:hypothetical protein
MKRHRCSDCKGGEILRVVTPQIALCLRCLGRRLKRKVTLKYCNRARSIAISLG